MSDPLTRDDLIDVLRRTTDPGWLDPLLQDTDSTAVINALADELAYLSGIGTALCDATTISLAPAGRSGTSLVTITRTASGIGGTIPKGYQFVDARGLLAVVQSDTAVAIGITSLQLSVATLRKTELVNTLSDPGYSISPTNVAVADSGGTNALISVSPAPAGFPPIVSTTFTIVAESTEIDGGASDFLSAHGAERGQARQPNESDEGYRARVRNVPDAVSPAAIAIGALGAAQNVGLPPPVTVEPFNDGASASVKAQYNLDWSDTYFASGILTTAGSADSGSPKVDFFDDMGVDLTNGKVRELVTIREMGCYFREEFPGPLADPDSSRSFFDDGFLDDDVFGFPDLSDHPAVIAALMAVWQECDHKRAAGVRFDVFVDTTTEVEASGTTAAAGPVTVWTLTPPVGKIWWFVHGNFGMDTSAAISQPETNTFYQLRFTFEDGTTLTTPRQFGPFGSRLDAPLVSSSPSQRITMIEGLAGSGGATVRLVGQFLVGEVVV